MYKLMLVDDEDAVRKNVINKINWDQYGFTIVCEANNGNEAYEMFEIYTPEVVITDIKMPFMNGLELSEKILEKYPFTKIIVLTGFDEFQYAKKSIDIHITNYILKPIASKELIDVLKEVKYKIDVEIQEKTDVERLKEYYEKSYPLMKNKFLEELVHGEYLEEEVNRWIKYYDLDLKGKWYLVSIIKIDNFYQKRKEENSKETEFKKIALLNMVDEIDESKPLGIYFLMNNQIVIISTSVNDDEVEFTQAMIGKCEEIRQGVEKFLQFTVTIGIGHTCEKVSQLYGSMKSALSAHDYKMAMGNNKVIYIKDLEKKEDQYLGLDEIKKRRIVRVLKAGNKEDWFEFVDEMFNEITILYIQQFQVDLLEILTLVIKTAKELQIDVNNFLNNEMNLYQMISNFDQLDYIRNNLLEMGEKIIQYVLKGRINTSIGIVSKAKEYVMQNYSDWELNIEKICKYLNYSPNYFSAVYKKETGQAFMNYLLEIRIEASKDLILRTDMKTFEIALKVGFSSSNYFSFCFKKKMNISPSTYRKKMKSI